MSSDLRTLINEAKALLGNTTLSEQSEIDSWSALRTAAQNWQEFMGYGDDLLAAVQGVVETATAASKIDDEAERKKVLPGVATAVEKVKSVSDKAYGAFAQGRESMYVAAKDWGISTRRSGKSKPKGSKPLDGSNDTSIVVEMESYSKKMSSSMKTMLDLTAKAVSEFKATAKAKEADAARKDALVNLGLDVRDAVSSSMFAWVNGIMRRAVEMSNRSWEKMNEGTKKAKWVAPWASDPEIGDVE